MSGRIVAKQFSESSVPQSNDGVPIHPVGVQFRGPPSDIDAAARSMRAFLAERGLAGDVRESSTEGGVAFALAPARAQAWTPGADTLRLVPLLGLDPDLPADIEKEIAVATLASPLAFSFPNFDEFLSSMNMRRDIAQAARKTALAFDTVHAERPAGYWRYSEATGFVVEAGHSLITALLKATQPDESGKLYSFSCYRATEYVILLAIAQELARSNPLLFAQLQQQWETRAIMSGEFHDTFLLEYGSMESPLPPRFFIPGDRLWFRNPDERSANVEGYEGSWVFYLGNGLFTNFWNYAHPFTLTTKCVEIFHWRDGVYQNADGGYHMDEAVVARGVAQTLSDPAAIARVLERMLRFRDVRGVYAEGGCIDTTRECPRWVRPGTAQIVLPGV